MLWFDGTLGGIQSLGGALDRSYTVTEGEVITLPAEWQGPDKYSNTLRGWYDLVNHQYYKPGAEYTVTGNTVFYADWVAASYDIGQFNAQAVDTVSTNHLITTKLYDYNMLFNLMSTSVDVTVSESGHSENWNLVTSGNVPFRDQQTINFIMRDWDAGGDISYPSNTNNANTYVNGDIQSGLYRSELAQILFGTEGDYDPETGTGVIGRTYLGTGDYLFQFADDPDHAYYGYYYYDSQYNAASYNRSSQRFYVYDYLAKTSSSGDSKPTDFLPLNSPYVNTNGKDLVTYTYDGVDGEYVGVNHFQYDNSYENTTTAGSNLWFGMTMEMRFYLPDVPGTLDADGDYGNLDMYGKQMHYHFSGDDDVWVFVDGVLVLDIGGIHGIQGGDINFSTGVATVDNGSTTDISWLEPGEHVLTLYYLERGGSESNCAMYFNISPRFSLDIQKEDVLTQELLDGTQFSVYTDYECTVPAQLWLSEQAYNTSQPSTHTFTVENGIATLWGLGSGKTYYIKETGPPNAEGYDCAHGLIKLTVDKQGFASYDVSVVPEADGTEPSNGFTVHDVSIDQDLQKMKITVTNAQSWVKETTTVQVYKEWDDGKAHSDDHVGVYLTITDPDGTVRRIRQVYLEEHNEWNYIWTNLPKYYSDQVTPVQYGIEESYFPGYYPTVERVTKLVITNTTWAEAYEFEPEETYILETSNGCLSTTSASAQTLQWVDEETAKNSPLALWKATISGDNIRFVNEAGQILSFNYGNNSSSRYFYATTGSGSSQNIRAEQSGNGLKLYCSYNNRILIAQGQFGGGGGTGNDVLHLGNALESQAVGHNIVQNIVLSTGMDADGGAEFHGLTDIGRVGVSPLTGGVFLDLLVDGGSAVLGIDGGIGVGGGQAAQSAHGGIHQVVAQLQAGEYTGGNTGFSIGGDHELTGIFGGLHRLDAVFLCPGQSALGKVCHTGIVVTVDPGNIAGLVDGNIGQGLGKCEELCPFRIDGVGIGTAADIIAFQIQELIDLVGGSAVAGNAVDGDAAGFFCGNADAHGTNHGQSQDDC